MPNSKVLFQELVGRIHIQEEIEEVHSMVYMILDHELGMSRTAVMSGKDIPHYNVQSLDRIIERINLHEPLQYIFGEADFFRRKFRVNPHVLIPRPETEQLISVLLALIHNPKPKILDIGTGSGCIAITLALEIAHAQVTAIDISKEALIVAKQNSTMLAADVTFVNHDILSEDLELEKFDIVVSNPPYIAAEEKTSMHKNVLDFEPHLALFAEHDPLIFYKRIASLARKAGARKPIIVVEINARFGRETLAILRDAGYEQSELVKDLQDKERFIIAQ